MIEIDNILDVEKYLDGVEAVIFDLDDTLYSEKDYVRSGYQAVAKAFPEIHCMFDELWEAFEQGKPALDVVFEKHSILSRKEDALHIYRFHKPTISLYPGMREMLDRLAASKKVGIITDGRPEGQRAKLEALGLIDVPFIITDELGGTQYRKPNDTAFRRMQEIFQTPFERMCYVGDNAAKDFQSSQQLGMRAVWFMNKDGLYKENSIIVTNKTLPLTKW